MIEAAVGEQGGAQQPSPARQARAVASPRSPRAPAAASGSGRSGPRAQRRCPWPARPSSLPRPLPRRRGSIASLLPPAAASMAGAAETASMAGSGRRRAASGRGRKVRGRLAVLAVVPAWYFSSAFAVDSFSSDLACVFLHKSACSALKCKVSLICKRSILLHLFGWISWRSKLCTKH